MPTVSSPGALQHAFRGARSNDIIPSAALPVTPVTPAMFRKRRQKDELSEDSIIMQSLHFPLYSSN
jgi:hypothetical protein